MAKKTSEGKCNLCGKTFGKAAMTRHLQKCLAAQPQSTRRTKPRKTFHVMVDGAWLAHYWMHIELAAEDTLETLDQFLRDIWLECCGHLSAFTINKQRYSVSPANEMFDFTDFHEENMNHKIQDVLQVGAKFTYEYDFGTTTELNLKVVAEREGTIKKNQVLILARNNPPDAICEECHKQPATQVCSVCVYYEKAWYCDNCAPKHKCARKGEDYFLPVVNSPRVGQCGYTGPENGI